ncbi:N-terminal phage integrase SAM-like domain-containing protein [Amycolatopsis sp. Hca4]|uniref:N-terminal phage integrase SAM-like domain-containing protein n=1 Tax=Amycolatopsis sp. Hca4 TaxID=2742131 RepID=UPI0015926797|nr:N-terminal phage integrase SAM-like domain-containing protein [Amycolatopsis sp. Hca4]QKV72498.1 hypothetical protein HUT10_00570 [Amycolatopsis sp. Hca4]
MDAMKAKAKKGVIINDRQTVGEYLVTWLNGKKDIKANTIKLYRGHINRYWLPRIGHIRLIDLRVAHVAAVIEAIDERNELILAGRLPKRVRFVCNSSKQCIRSMLRTALNNAIRAEDGPIAVNVAALVKLPSGKSPKPMVWTEERAVMAWRADHTGQFLDYVADHPLYAMWYRMVHRGPRCGECAGWSGRRTARCGRGIQWS